MKTGRLTRSRKKLLFEVIGLSVAALIVSFVSRDFLNQPNASSTTEVRASLSPDSSDTVGRLSVYDPAQAFAGYTLYPADGNSEVWLLNMKGEIIHTWKADAERARLLPNGHLLVVHGSKFGRNKKPWRKLRDTIREYDWESNVVWEYTAEDVIHHDVKRLANGNTLFLKRTVIPASLQQKISDSSRRALRLRGDSVLEVSPAKELIFQWDAHEHLDIDSCGSRGCDYLSGTDEAEDRGRDWTHMNTVSPLPENKWYKNGDSRFRPGNLIVLPRNWWTVLIIDKLTGEKVWEYSGEYKGGLSGGHEAHMIEPGLPGAGNILIFDNGSAKSRGRSAVLEVNPSDKSVVWKYENENFWSRTRGSLQRLPNGNTLVSEDTEGRVFEVNSDKELVWEFSAPGYESNRAMRYAEDFCEPCSKLPLG
jgi:hypothetical protein